MPIDPLDMKSIYSLVQLLKERAEKHPDRTLFTYLADGENETAQFSFSDLDSRARATAAVLQLSCEDEDRALILMPSSLEFVVGFFACLYAKVVAVPAYPPRANRNLERLLAIVDDSQAKVVLTTKQVKDLVTPWFEKTPQLKKMKWIAVDEEHELSRADWIEPHIHPTDLAFFQYTSGSTGSPKGVMLTHQNLLANLSMIQSSFKFDPSSIMVSWLPMFHDMGLIGCVLEPIYAGCQAVIMPPTAFLERPRVWLKAISKYKGTVAGAPNFAYELCVRKCKVDDNDLSGVDLSSLKVLFNGAEPIRFTTIKDFSEKFAALGFASTAFFPCYGLAEATLLVSSETVGNGPKNYFYDKEQLEKGIFKPSESENKNDAIVCTGKAPPNSRFLIVHPDSTEVLEEGQVGEVWINGPHIAVGYWKKEEESKRVFHAKPAGNFAGNFLRTGDLGFVYNGELFITGRIKDLIIIGGRNYYPQDIEIVAEQTDTRIRAGGVACFSFEQNGKEQIGLVAEVERTAIKTNLEELAQSINQNIWKKNEVAVQIVALIKPGSLPKTSSGKVQRRASKQRALEGSLDLLWMWQGSGVVLEATKHENHLAANAEPAKLNPSQLEVVSQPKNQVPTSTPSKPAISRKPIDPVSSETNHSSVMQPLLLWLAKNLEISPEKIQGKDSLPSLGVDSIVVAEMYVWIEENYGVKVPQDLAWEASNVDTLCRKINEIIKKGTAA